MNDINLTDLNIEQLKSLKKQLAARAKERTGNHAKRNGIIDRMLHERNGDEFKHTTADILAALQTAKIVAVDLSNDERATELKKIQTRKQLLDKQPEHKGKVGYKASPTGIGALTVERAVAFLKANAPQLLK